MSEYKEWCVSYNKYLFHMYKNIFFTYLTRAEKKEITFEKFCEFVYSQSSGEIIDYL